MPSRAPLRQALAGWLAPGLALWLVLCGAAQAQGPLREWAQERRAAREGAPTEAAAGSITRPGQHLQTLRIGGQERRYLVHVPRSYDGTRAVPLLLSFHGGGGHMELQADDTRYGQISASEREGFIAVFPNGSSRMPRGRLATWNAGGCCGNAKEQGVDDVAFARAVVEAVARQLRIDRRQVFATGFSNGAMLAHRLACEASDVFKAIAAVAGTDNTTACQPAQPVSVLVIHARNDDHNPFEGGVGAKSVDRGNMAGATSVPETVSRWVGRNGCTAEPERVLERPGASCERHGGCRGGVSVALCVTETGAHSWPGASRARGDEAPSQALDANAVMWSFFLGRKLP